METVWVICNQPETKPLDTLAEYFEACELMQSEITQVIIIVEYGREMTCVLPLPQEMRVATISHQASITRT